MDDKTAFAYAEEHSHGWQTELEKPCVRCESLKGEVIKMAIGPHYAKVVCWDCGRFQKYLPKPMNEGKRKSRERLKPQINYCEFCLRTKDELDGTATIEEHHVLEVQEFPELERDPSNIWVLCTRCHLSIHNIRRMVRGSAGKKEEALKREGFLNGKSSA